MQPALLAVQFHRAILARHIAAQLHRVFGVPFQEMRIFLTGLVYRIAKAIGHVVVAQKRHVHL